MNSPSFWVTWKTERHTHIEKGKSKKESVHLNYLINIRLEITVQCLYSVHSINYRKTNVVFEYFILSKGKSSNNWLIYILLHSTLNQSLSSSLLKAQTKEVLKKQINVTKNMWIVFTIKTTIKPSHRGNNDFLKFFTVLLCSAFLYTFLNRQQC